MGTDSPGDIQPPVYEHLDFPLHILGVYSMGLWILDNADFEGLASTCSQLKQYVFAVQMAPLLMQGATGSPVNPIALF